MLWVGPDSRFSTLSLLHVVVEGGPAVQWGEPRNRFPLRAEKLLLGICCFRGLRAPSFFIYNVYGISATFIRGVTMREKRMHQAIGMVNDDFTEIMCYVHERHNVGKCPWCDYMRVQHITNEFLWRMENCGTKINHLHCNTSNKCGTYAIYVINKKGRGTKTPETADS